MSKLSWQLERRSLSSHEESLKAEATLLFILILNHILYPKNVRNSLNTLCTYCFFVDLNLVLITGLILCLPQLNHAFSSNHGKYALKGFFHSLFIVNITHLHK